MKAYLGIDTSCYTTSCALLSEDGTLLAEARKILEVKPGHCGLQQSEMVFQHTRNLPGLVEEVLAVPQVSLAGIGVSGRPRPKEDSYMPAFLAGLSVARSLAAALKVPLQILSHQENHVEAGLWSAGGPGAERFLALHASGGTTDLLLVQHRQGRYELEQVGGSVDLHAGQFIDRIGVALGLQFPTGPALERLAATAKGREELPISNRKLEISLSGPATAAQRRLAAGVDPAELALGVEYCLAESFARLFVKAAQQYHIQDVLLVGGVGCNSFIRRHLEERLAAKGLKLWVPEGRFSCDNASGCASYARVLANEENLYCQGNK